VPITDVQVQDGLLTVIRAEQGALVRVSLRGELDLSNVPTLERTLDEAIDSGKKVLIDLDRLEFLDSTGLALIVHMLGRSDAERFSFVPSRHRGVCRLFTLTGLDERMAIDTAADEALPSLNAA
jgi:anti-sigma B factor antagonist